MDVVEIDSEKQKQIVKLFPMLSFVVKWIEKDTKLSDSDLMRLKNIYPEQYEIVKNSTFEEIIEIDKQYCDHPIYGDLIKIVLSEQGIEWLQDFFSRLREFSAMND